MIWAVKIFLFLITSIIFLGFQNLAFAEADSSTSSASPSAEYSLPAINSVANLRDRIFERITLFFKFSTEDNYNYQKALADKRLAELKYVVDSGQGNLIEETSSRYSSYLGRLNNYVISKKLTDKKPELLAMYNSHNQILQGLSSKFETDSGFWLLIQHDINTTKILSDQIKGL